MLRTAGIFSCLIVTALALCPTNFTLVRNGECYKQMTLGLQLYATNAASSIKKTCSDLKAQPVIIKSQEDHDYWLKVGTDNRQKNVLYGSILLGIECSSEGKYVWMDGSPISFKPAKYDADLDRACSSSCAWVLDATYNEWTDNCYNYLNADTYCTTPPVDQSGQMDPECSDFARDEEDDVCYQIGATAVNWTEANTVCRSFGANVASIHNVQENNFIRRLAVSKGLVNGLFLGGAPSGKKNTFGWIDGTDFDYENFVPGFPIDGFGDCLAMETNTVNGPWLNLECNTPLPVACVRKVTDKEPVCDGGMRKEGDLIYSPGFPGDSSTPCDFLLKVDVGMVVEVEILLLEANSCCDHLVLSEGALGGAVVADLTGDLATGKKYRTNSSNIMRASWQPNGAKNVKGMMITYRAVKP